MIDIDESLLRLRAKMVLKHAERKLRTCSDEEKKTGFSLRAYYLGREFPKAKSNPFASVEHPFQKSLMDSFCLGVSDRLQPKTLTCSVIGNNALVSP